VRELVRKVLEDDVVARVHAQVVERYHHALPPRLAASPVRLARGAFFETQLAAALNRLRPALQHLDPGYSLGRFRLARLGAARQPRELHLELRPRGRRRGPLVREALGLAV